MVQIIFGKPHPVCSNKSRRENFQIFILFSKNRSTPGLNFGPILFTLFINDLPDTLYSSLNADYKNLSVTLFADDTNILLHHINPEVVGTNLLITKDCLTRWLTTNKLKLNVSKTNAVVFHRQPDNQIIKSCSDIKISKTTKFLGIHLDSNLKWRTHIDTLCKSLNSIIFALRCLSNFSSKETLSLAYNGILESKLRYGIIFWGFCDMQNFNRIFILQKRALRIVWGLGPGESCREHFRSDGVLTFPSLLVYACLDFVYNNPHFFTTPNHSYSTRNKHSLEIDKFKLNIFKNSVFYYGPKLFNKLPVEIRLAPSAMAFRRGVRRCLAERAYYSLQEALEG